MFQKPLLVHDRPGGARGRPGAIAPLLQPAQRRGSPPAVGQAARAADLAPPLHDHDRSGGVASRYQRQAVVDPTAVPHRGDTATAAGQAGGGQSSSEGEAGGTQQAAL